MIHIKINNINTGGRKGVVKNNINKQDNIIQVAIEIDKSIILAPLLFKKELKKVRVVIANPRETSK